MYTGIFAEGDDLPLKTCSGLPIVEELICKHAVLFKNLEIHDMENL